jgi:hypothetical protein
MTMYASATSFEALPADLNKEGYSSKRDLIVVCLVSSVGLVLTGLVYLLGFGAELTWALAAG